MGNPAICYERPSLCKQVMNVCSEYVKINFTLYSERRARGRDELYSLTVVLNG